MSDIKKQISGRINAFAKHDIASASTLLLDTLGYHSDRRVDIPSVSAFMQMFDPQNQLNHTKAKITEWQTIQLLFQLTDDDIPGLAGTRSMFSAFEQQQMKSYLFFAIELNGQTYTRTELADITRQVNRLFQIPVFVIFRYATYITVAIINRRANKRDTNLDVLGKVTLIKDISIHQPHRAHIEILHDLTFSTLLQERNIRTFDDLHAAWARVLDTNILNKRFYKELADWYFWTLGEVRFPADAPKDSDGSDSISVIRMVTRLMFCWFLKEKGLLPTTIFEPNHISTILKDTAPTSSSYYKAVIQNLFFATLNTEMGQRGFRSPGQHYMVHNLYRYSELLHDPDAFVQLLADVPFMNGGLFECLDKSDNGKSKRIDGFSDRPDNAIHVPNKVFLGEEIATNLEAIYNDKGARSVRVRGLIHILDSYKFTITENTPIEEEIALDPELLGKVFENLLAAYSPDTKTTARNQTGSFYTPREIVDYMVDEAIILKLQPRLEQHNPQRTDHRERLVDLVSYSHTNHQFDANEVTVLIASIDQLKILDPACGSGAFPMGILHKLVHILSKLDPNNQRWRQRQIDRIEALEDIVMRKEIIADVEASFSAHELDYGRKLYLIQNCIYGVDIQPIAVQISKLRFFISLLVNQQVTTGKNRGILPLPNLETNFIAANTLLKLSEKRPITQRSLIDSEIDILKDELRTQRSRYFSARTSGTKEKARAEDKRIRTNMHNILTNSGWSAQDATILANWDMYDQNTHADFFDPEWMFGIERGFDIVIGNPPYLRIQGLQATQSQYMERYKRYYQSATGNYDLYALFIERGYDLLKDARPHERGILAYIVPHKFFIAKFGEGLRKLLTEHQALTSVVKFGALQLFDEATTYSSLIFLSSDKQPTFDLVEVKQLTTGSDVLDIARRRTEASVAEPVVEFDNRPTSIPPTPNVVHPDLDYGVVDAPITTEWNFSLGARDTLYKRIKQHPFTLESITSKIFVGLQTSADKIYVLDVIDSNNNNLICYSHYLNENISIEDNMVKPFLMGRDIHRFEQLHPKRVVLFPYDTEYQLLTDNLLSKLYPNAWSYLLRVKDVLSARENGRFENSWWQYGRPQNLDSFTQVKILSPDLCARPEMTLDIEGIYHHTTTVCSIVFNDQSPRHIYYMLGVLNSQMLRFHMTVAGNDQRGGYHRYTPGYLKPFPIPESTTAQQQLIATFVQYVLALKREKLQLITSRDLDIVSNFFERVIDNLVYELYVPEVFEHQPQLRASIALSEVDLPTIAPDDVNALSTLIPIYQLLSHQDHPVRYVEYYINTLNEVRIITGKETKDD